MAKITSAPRLDLRIRFEINEAEARAMDALAGYGTDAFVQAFYEVLGKAYMRDHESGLREFLDTIRTVVGPAIHKINEARQLLKESK